jgi:hypothetical protein
MVVKINFCFLGFSDMQNRFVPERVTSCAEHNKEWVKVQAGQHHTILNGVQTYNFSGDRY